MHHDTELDKLAEEYVRLTKKMLKVGVPQIISIRRGTCIRRLGPLMISKLNDLHKFYKNGVDYKTIIEDGICKTIVVHKRKR